MRNGWWFVGMRCAVYIEYNMLGGRSLLPEMEEGDP